MLQVIGLTDDIQETFYAISVERRISNPMVTAVIEAANKSLFAHNNTEKVL